VDARAWRFYATGVFNGCNQTNPDLDHAVQLVGYGTENNTDYWLVRNSWTPAWGEGGYIKIYRTDNGMSRKESGCHLIV
jgi:cathepsin L